MFLYVVLIWIRALNAKFVRGNNYLFADLRKFYIPKKAFVRKTQIYKLQIRKSQKLGQHRANLQGATFAEGPQIK